MQNYAKIILIMIGSILSACGILLVKNYMLHSNLWYLLAAVLSSIALIYVYTILLRTGDVLIDFSVIKISSILLVAIPSLLFFHSKLTIKKIVGLILGFASICLLS